jgi:two-component system CheB/CheR fusion protein
VNAFLESILTSLRVGVVVLDRDLRVEAWNHQSMDLWGLRSDEVIGKNFLNLDIGLPVDQLKQPIRAILAGETEEVDRTLDATNRRGKRITCRVTLTPLSSASHAAISGAILIVENVRPIDDSRDDGKVDEMETIDEPHQ